MAKETPRAKALRLLQKMARMREVNDLGYGECVSCGKTVHWKEADGGHYLPKGASSYWALDERCVHLQCKGCNGFGMKFGTSAQRYTIWMQDMYGSNFVKDMLATKNTIHKLYKADYEEMIKHFNEEIKIQKTRLGD